MHFNSIKAYHNNMLHLVNTIILFFLFIMIIVSQVLMGRIQIELGISNGRLVERATSLFVFGKRIESGVNLSGKLGDDAVKLAVVGGVPGIYGDSLGVSYDKVESSMDIMRQYDPDSGTKAIVLDSQDLERYRKIGIRISCEYCCGANSIIFSDGKSACGCAHAKAMRGLLAYLLKYNGTQFTDDQILRELSRWKGRYFPKQMIQKVATQIQSGSYTPDVAALLLDIKLPNYSNSSGSVPLPSSIEDLPGMVGGC